MSFIHWNAYLLHCTYIRPKPKDKFAICVPSDGKNLFFFINTKPRTIVDSCTQLEVSSIELPFLKYNSYINTADFITCIVGSTCEVKKEFGLIPNQVIKKIKIAVEDSETLPSRFIQSILEG